MMATYSKVLLLMVSYTYFAVVNGNFTMHTPLNGSEILCLEDCDFFADNQTIPIINSTNPRTSVTGVAYYSTPIRMKDPTTKGASSFNTSFTFREEPQIYNASAPGNISLHGEGFALVMSNSSRWEGVAGGRLGIFASNSKENPKVIAAEFDSLTDLDTEPDLVREEHVDVRSPISVPSCFAYVHDTLGISLWKRNMLHSWIECDGISSILQVRSANWTFSSFGIPDGSLLGATAQLPIFLHGTHRGNHCGSL